jgi:septum formation protein
MDKPIYLASRSPRRRELLALTGLNFRIHPIERIDEDAILRDYRGEVTGGAEFLALEKGRVAMTLEMPGIFITADTLVISDDGKVLGKPRDNDEARLFLDRLAGNWHTVATGVALSEAPCEYCPEGRLAGILETTRVKFAPMNAVEIQEYIETGEPFDKAGGYGIQGRASIYIERIDGCYFNVVGFPLHSFWQMWKKFNA